MELHIQKHLRNGGTVDELKEELSLGVHEHPESPLIGFSYSQIDSPKTLILSSERRVVSL